MKISYKKFKNKINKNKSDKKSLIYKIKVLKNTLVKYFIKTWFYINLDILYTYWSRILENIIDIINKAQLKTIDKDTFLSIASMCSFIPKSITENNTWKKLPLSAKEVYRTLVANYDYELGIAKTTHSQILNDMSLE